MKAFLFTFLAVLACVSADPTSEAEAEAEAKPWLSSPYRAGYPYGAVYPAYGYQAVQPYGYHAYGARPYYSGHYIGKREAEAAPEAEADPEADAWLAYGYGHPYAYSGLPYPYHNVLPTLKKVEKVEAKPVTYTHHPYGVYPYGVHHPLVYSHHVGKREAEATPEANPEAEADPWLTYGAYTPHTYSPYTRYAHVAPSYSAYHGYNASPYGSYPFYG